MLESREEASYEHVKEERPQQQQKFSPLRISVDLSDPSALRRTPSTDKDHELSGGTPRPGSSGASEPQESKKKDSSEALMPRTLFNDEEELPSHTGLSSYDNYDNYDTEDLSSAESSEDSEPEVEALPSDGLRHRRGPCLGLSSSTCVKKQEEPYAHEGTQDLDSEEEYPAIPGHSVVVEDYVPIDSKQLKEEACWREVVIQSGINKGLKTGPQCFNLVFCERLLGRFINPERPTLLSELVKYVTVTPYTIITPLSLYYQLYLNEIFHTNFISRGAHFVLMPCITWTYLLFAAQFFNSSSSKPPVVLQDGRGIELFPFNGAFFLSLIFLIWWICWGIVTKTYAFGFFMIPALLVQYVTANIFYFWTRFEEEGGSWSVPFYANPWVLGLGFATLQALSHLSEPLPPRMNRTDHWETQAEFLKKHWPTRKWYVLAVWGPQFVFGTINEFLAAPRLFPLLNLKLMHMLGYKRAQWKHLMKLVKWARRYHDPALDYIGRGGGRPAARHVPPFSAALAREEFASLRDSKDPEDMERCKFLKSMLVKTTLIRLAGGPFLKEFNNATTPSPESGEDELIAEGMDDEDLPELEDIEDEEYQKRVAELGQLPPGDFSVCLKWIQKDVHEYERRYSALYGSPETDERHSHADKSKEKSW